MENPTLEQFDRCRKYDLCAIAAHYDIPVSRYLMKHKVKYIVLTGLMEQGVFPLEGSERSNPNR